MRIVVIMKSRISYERFESDLKDYTVHKHVTSVGDIQECVSYWNPDIAVLDIHSPVYQEAKKLFFNFDVDVVEFTSDFDSAIEEVKSYSAFYDSETEVQTTEKAAKEMPDFSQYEIKPREEPKKEVVVQIKKEIIEVEKEVEVVAYTNVPSKLIVVASLWHGAGSTFLAANLARAIANRGIQVSYIEYPTANPYMFDYLNVTSLEETGKFNYTDIAKLIDKNGIIPRGKSWSYRGVQWILNDPREPSLDNWSFEYMLRLIYSVNTPITIIDLSTAWSSEEVKGLLHQADNIYICVEPDPIKVTCLTPYIGVAPHEQRKAEQFIQYVKGIEKTEGIPYDFIITKMNDGANKKEFINALEKEPLAELDYIPYTKLTEFAWESVLAYDTEDYKDLLDKMLLPTIKEVLPTKFHYLEEATRKRLVSFLNPFGKRKRGQPSD